MHHAVGQVGWVVTLIVVVLACLVVASKHIVLATCSFELGREPTEPGWHSLHPMIILYMNYIGWVGVGGAAALCRKGDAIFMDVVETLKGNVWGG
jgi:hypothetical protein